MCIECPKYEQERTGYQVYSFLFDLILHKCVEHYILTEYQYNYSKLRLRAAKPHAKLAVTTEGSISTSDLHILKR